MKSSLEKYLLELLLIALSLVLIFARGSTLGDPGVGWHLKNGEYIVVTQSIPYVDRFLSEFSSKSWISDQWASDVILFLAYSFGSFSLLHLLAALLPILSFGIILGREVIKIAPTPISALFIILAAWVTASIQWFTRPVLFSFLLFTIFYCSLRKIHTLELSRKELILYHVKIFTLFAIWANLHPGFALASIPIASLFINSIFKKTNLLIPFGISVAAFLGSLVNPYGIALHQSILKLVLNPYFMQLNKEWLPPEISDPFFLGFYLSSLALVVTCIILKPRELSKFDFVSVLILLVLSLKQRRYIPFFAIPMSLFFAEAARTISFKDRSYWVKNLPVVRLFFLHSEKERINFPWLTSLSFIFLLVWVAQFGSLPSKTNEELSFPDAFPKSVVAQLENESSIGTIFGSPDIGGFLTWHLWPKANVFIDDRNTLIGEQRYRDYFALRDAKEGWEDILEKNNFKYLLLKDSDNLNQHITNNPGWVLLEQASNTTYKLYKSTK